MHYNLNIIVTDDSPEQAAKNLSDPRIPEMILGSAHLMIRSFLLNRPESIVSLSNSTCDSVGLDLSRVHSGPIQPSLQWAKQSQGNYSWLLLYFLWLCDEYEFRFEEKHQAEKLRDTLCLGYDYIPKGPQTSFVNRAGEFMHIKKTTDAYQRFFLSIDPQPIYTKRKPPSWNSR